MKIAFLGPESSGKTSIISLLKEDLDAEIVPEFAREYLKEIKTNYCYEDLEIIAKNQFNSIQKPHKKEFVLIDTELIVMKIWSEFKYRKCCDFILENIKKQAIDFYFLCRGDFPWEEDDLRENKDNREKLFNLYEQVLIENNFKYSILEGEIETRRKFFHKTLKSLI
jgi:nicotinamide riboside kinase